MPFCSDCGVEFDDDLNSCPLCRGCITATEPPRTTHYPQQTHVPRIERLPRRKKHWILLEVISILLLVPLLVVIPLDLSRNGSVTWSAYTAVILGSVWVLVVLVVALASRASWLPPLVVVDALLMLAALDAIDGSLDWFAPIVLPTTIVLVVIVAMTWLLVRRLEIPLISTMGVALVACGVFCLCLDAILKLYQRGSLSLSWSLPTVLSVLPPALTLFYVQYRLPKDLDLKKFLDI